MSTTTFTEPASLEILIAPLADSAMVAPLAVGFWPAFQLIVEAFGIATSAGKMVRKLCAVPPTTVMLAVTAVAVVGMVHCPFEPRTANTVVSSGPNGPDLGPTSVAGRVSISRHGVIDTNDDGAVDGAAITVNSPPAPIATATAAPIAAQRERTRSNRRVPMSRPHV